MRSNKKCPYCGEFEEETIYASGMGEGENAGPGRIVSECKNYEKCPKYNPEKK